MIKTLLTKYKYIFGKEDTHDNQTFETLISEVVQYYETIIKCMPGNVYWIDTDCLAVGCNQNVLDMFGFHSISQFKGLSFEEMGKIGNWTPEATQSFKDDTLAVINTGTAKLNIEEPPIPHADGRVIYFLTSRVPIVNQKNELMGVVGISIDISDKKRVEILQKEIEIVQEKNETLRLMGASIAHELRTPLATMKFGASAIKEHLPTLLDAYRQAQNHGLVIKKLPPNLLKGLYDASQIIEEETKNSNNIINMFLVNAGQAKIDPEDFTSCSINNCVTDALNRYPFTGEDRQLIHWQKGEDFEFYGTQLLTEHILFNLLKNAIYYVKAVGKGHIEIWVEKNAEYNKLHFKDLGKGISAEILPKIFDRFFTKTYHGTGVGLAFCKMVMEAYEGNISCDSIEGEYTHFTLSFPQLIPRDESSKSL